MRRARWVAGVGALVAASTALTAITPAAAGAPPVKVILDDLSSPKGVATTPSGDPVVAQGAFGPPGPVLVLPLRGRGHGTPFEVTDPVNLIDVAVSPLDGTGWAIGQGELGEPVLFHQLIDGTIVAVLDITAYQEGDPDPDDIEGDPLETNPYGLTVMANGDALVADAAGNDIIRVTPAGDAWTVARFGVRLVSTDHLSEPGLPPALPAEAVPTTVTIGPDGAIYVGQLMGFPFRPGTSNIWRIEPDATGAECTVGVVDDDCSVYLEGFTAIQDIAFDPNNGRLYVYELAEAGVLAFEEGFETGQFPPAVLWEVKRNRRTELAAGQLSEPGGVAVARNGKVYVTDGVFTSGRLLRVVG